MSGRVKPNAAFWPYNIRAIFGPVQLPADQSNHNHSFTLDARIVNVSMVPVNPR
jgi:hypothetical protein